MKIIGFFRVLRGVLKELPWRTITSSIMDTWWDCERATILRWY
jgi:hypothetical protein